MGDTYSTYSSSRRRPDPENRREGRLRGDLSVGGFKMSSK
jgi:hypothetical protein